MIGALAGGMAAPLVADGAATVGELLIEGLGKAAVYFIISVGLTLVFGLMGILNFAHGAMSMLGAYFGGVILVFAVGSGSGTITTIAFFFVAMAVVFATLTVAGSAVEATLIRRIYDRTPMYQILLTFGIALILEELMRIILTLRGIQPEPTWISARETAPAILGDRQEVLGMNFFGLYIFEFILGVVVLIAVYLFLTETKYGLYIRAGSEDSEMVEALGIDVRKAFTVVFGVGTGLAAMGGVLLMWDPTWGASVELSIDVLLFAFVVVIIGGLGSFKGTVAASVLVGLTDAVTTWLFTTGIVDFPGLTEVSVFLLLVIMLIIKPQGLYGVEEVGGH